MVLSKLFPKRPINSMVGYKNRPEIPKVLECLKRKGISVANSPKKNLKILPNMDNFESNIPFELSSYVSSHFIAVK